MRVTSSACPQKWKSIMAANNNVRWSDSATTTMLELLRTRESLWNVKAASYRDRNKKKSEYEEILVGLEDDVPGIDLASLKGTVY